MYCLIPNSQVLSFSAESFSLLSPSLMIVEPDSTKDICRLLPRLWLNIHKAGRMLAERTHTRETCDYSWLRRHDIHKNDAFQRREGRRGRWHRETGVESLLESHTSWALLTRFSFFLKHPFDFCFFTSQIKVCLGTVSSMKIYSFIFSNVLKERALSLQWGSIKANRVKMSSLQVHQHCSLW